MQQLVYDTRLDTVKLKVHVNGLLFVPWFSKVMSSALIVNAEESRCCLWYLGKIYSRANPICQIDTERKKL